MFLEAASREIVLQDPDNYRFYVNHLGQAVTGIYFGKQESANSQQAKCKNRQCQGLRRGARWSFRLKVLGRGSLRVLL